MSEQSTPPASATRRRRPAKAQPLTLAATGSVAVAFSALLRNCMQQMQANEYGVLHGRNPEFLHQYRVGLRRLRSALRIYKPALTPDRHGALDEQLRWLAGALGPARDWDVLIAETVLPLMRCEPQAAGLAALHRRCVAERRRQVAAMHAASRDPRYAELGAALERYATNPPWRDDDAASRLLKLPLTAFACTRIAKREKRLLTLAQDLATAGAAERHRLRIAAKKLRYAIALFASLFDRHAVRRHTVILAALQDILGKLNDCATARRLLEALPTGRDQTTANSATAMLLDWIRVQEQHASAALDLACRDWRAQKLFCANE